MATGLHSIHAHGVAYGKQSEGGYLLAQLQMNLTAVTNQNTPVTLYHAVFLSVGVTVGTHDVGQHNKQGCLSFSKILTRDRQIIKVHCTEVQQEELLSPRKSLSVSVHIKRKKQYILAIVDAGN